MSHQQSQLQQQQQQQEGLVCRPVSDNISITNMGRNMTFNGDSSVNGNCGTKGKTVGLDPNVVGIIEAESADKGNSLGPQGESSLMGSHNPLIKQQRLLSNNVSTDGTNYFAVPSGSHHLYSHYPGRQLQNVDNPLQSAYSGAPQLSPDVRDSCNDDIQTNDSHRVTLAPPPLFSPLALGTNARTAFDEALNSFGTAEGLNEDCRIADAGLRPMVASRRVSAPRVEIKLFVNRVPKELYSSALHSLFSAYGEVRDVVIIRDRESLEHKGCAFIRMASITEADAAIRALNNKTALNPKLGCIQVKYAAREAERLGMPPESAIGGLDQVKLFAGSLPKAATEADVRAVFACYGQVDEVFVMRDENKVSKGCAFVRFAFKEEALHAIANLNGKYVILGGVRAIEVRFAESRKAQPKVQAPAVQQRAVHAIDQRSEVETSMRKSGNRVLRSSDIPSDVSNSFAANVGAAPLSGGENSLYCRHCAPNSSLPLSCTHFTQPLGQTQPLLQSSIQQQHHPHHCHHYTTPSASTNPIAEVKNSALSPNAPSLNNIHSEAYAPSSIAAAPWMEYHTDEGQAYYYNMHTGKTQWERPPLLLSFSEALQQPLYGSNYHLQTQEAQQQQQHSQEPQSHSQAQQQLPPALLRYLTPPTTTIYSPASKTPNVTLSRAGSTPSTAATSPTASHVEKERAITIAAQAVAGGQTHGLPGANLFIFHLPNEWSETDLVSHFSPYGSIISARIATDKRSNRRLGFGFVSYSTVGAAVDAVTALNGIAVGDKRLKVAIKRGEEEYAEPYLKKKGAARSGCDSESGAIVSTGSLRDIGTASDPSFSGGVSASDVVLRGYCYTSGEGLHIVDKSRNNSYQPLYSSSAYPLIEEHSPPLHTSVPFTQGRDQQSQSQDSLPYGVQSHMQLPATLVPQHSSPQQQQQHIQLGHHHHQQYLRPLMQGDLQQALTSGRQRLVRQQLRPGNNLGNVQREGSPEAYHNPRILSNMPLPQSLPSNTILQPQGADSVLTTHLGPTAQLQQSSIPEFYASSSSSPRSLAPYKSTNMLSQSAAIAAAGALSPPPQLLRPYIMPSSAMQVEQTRIAGESPALPGTSSADRVVDGGVSATNNGTEGGDHNCMWAYNREMAAEKSELAAAPPFPLQHTASHGRMSVSPQSSHQHLQYFQLNSSLTADNSSVANSHNEDENAKPQGSTYDFPRQAPQRHLSHHEMQTSSSLQQGRMYRQQLMQQAPQPHHMQDGSPEAHQEHHFVQPRALPGASSLEPVVPITETYSPHLAGMHHHHHHHHHHHLQQQQQQQQQQLSQKSHTSIQHSQLQLNLHDPGLLARSP